MSIPPFLINLVTRLPPNQQEVLQTFIMKAIQDRYLVALATVPIASTLAYVPHFIKFFILTYRQKLSYNNLTPRTTNLQSIEGKPGVLERLRGAHLNSLEMFPFFAFSVLFARVQKVDPAPLTKLAVKYIMQRMLYIIAYALGVNNLISYLRSVAWGTSLITTYQIAFLALNGSN